ncbi:hypothetical protein GCM10010452_86750 [Crossiella cryophila]
MLVQQPFRFRRSECTESDLRIGADQLRGQGGEVLVGLRAGFGVSRADALHTHEVEHAVAFGAGVAEHADVVDLLGPQGADEIALVVVLVGAFA